MRVGAVGDCCELECDGELEDDIEPRRDGELRLGTEIKLDRDGPFIVFPLN